MVMETKALDYALAAILLVYNMEGALHPIAFHSHTFTSPELNYDVHDKQLSAIFFFFFRSIQTVETLPGGCKGN